MTSEMLWPAAAASSRGQGLQSALEQTFTKISCSFFNIELSNKNGKALKMRQYKNATKSPPLVKSKSFLTSGNPPPHHFFSGCSKTQMNHMHYTGLASKTPVSGVPSNGFSHQAPKVIASHETSIECMIWKYLNIF